MDLTKVKGIIKMQQNYYSHSQHILKQSFTYLLCVLTSSMFCFVDILHVLAFYLCILISQAGVCVEYIQLQTFFVLQSLRRMIQLVRPDVFHVIKNHSFTLVNLSPTKPKIGNQNEMFKRRLWWWLWHSFEEWTLPIPENLSSHPVSSNFYQTFNYHQWWEALVQWLQEETDDQEVVSSNPDTAYQMDRFSHLLLINCTVL